MSRADSRRSLAHDDFRDGTARWCAELETGGTVTARDGVLDIDVPGGASVWFREPFSGRYAIEYTATPVSAGGPHDRVSDLNAFWSARDARSPENLFASSRSGAFADYDHLLTYYVGFGGNHNTTTRFRRYTGTPGRRPLLPEHDLEAPLLVPGRPYHVRLVADGERIQYWSNGELVFDYADEAPYAGGWFAFRTTASHFTVSGFRAWALPD
jgi:Domain of unknown function (DUF6250)